MSAGRGAGPPDTRLGLELHPEKTRKVNLYDRQEGFDFLGHHLHKRMSGKIWEQRRKRLYFLHRWPSDRAMKGIREKVRKRTPRGPEPCGYTRVDARFLVDGNAAIWSAMIPAVR